MKIPTLILLVPPILIALTFHEFAQAWMANRLGDPTARYLGRMTLNPMAHLDPLGTIMIFLVRFGWAKPVPVDPRNLANPSRDMMWISAAGPLMNMFLALISGLAIRLLAAMGLLTTQGQGADAMLSTMLFLSLYINLALAVFNILPIPPLDGSKILAGILPRRYAPQLAIIEARGPMILFGILFLGFVTNIHILGFLIDPWVNLFRRIFAGI